MAMRGPRHPIGAASWTTDERATALHIAQAEVDEFSFSAKNEMDWLNEHMAEIFSENKINVADIFKTPGKLRGKTPRTARKGDMRAPLTDVFSSTPKGAPNPFAVSKLSTLQQQQRRRSPPFKVAEDQPASRRSSRKSPSPRVTRPKTAAAIKKTAAAKKAAKTKKVEPELSIVDSGYHGSDSQDSTADENRENGEFEEEDELAAAPPTPEQRPASRKAIAGGAMAQDTKQMAHTEAPPVASPGGAASQTTQPTTDDASFHSAQEEQAAPTTMAHMATTTTTRQVIFSSPMCSVDAGSSPFCPVRASMAAPDQLPKSSSPPRPAASASPVRKPVPQPSSPLQSTTPACPPPRELLAARDGDFPVTAAAALSPDRGHMHVLPAVPTPPITSTPVFIAAQRVAGLPPKDGSGDDIVIAEDEDAEDDVEAQMQLQQEEEEHQAQSPSDPSSPARPVVRKSSINFASLPAREPFTSNKSMGGGMSRISHIDPGRTSHYNRPTGGKSLGNNVRAAEPEKEAVEDIDMHGGEQPTAQSMSSDADEDAAVRSKTYAQRLHDRISMLGKSQANGMRPSKSLATHLPGQNPLSARAQPQQSQQPAQWQPQTQPTPKKAKDDTAAAPAADEDDEQEEEDDWITPPPIAATTSPRLNMAKSMAMNVVQEPPVMTAAESHAKAASPKESPQAVSRPASPIRKPLPPTALERAASVVPAHPGHSKSASVPSLPLDDTTMATTTAKPFSVSNPTYPTLAAVHGTTDQPSTPSKSPLRNYRDSPLKQVKNKLSSILKSSKGLLASSAAISAEGKSSLLMSPSATRLGLLVGPSTESLMLKARSDSTSEPACPDLSRQISASTTTSTASAASATSSQDARSLSKSPTREGSPVRPIRKTRASTERERREEKQREKEEKDTQRMAEQMEKLEKLREKEWEKARVFSAEQARLAAAEKAEREHAEREHAERAERERAERAERERAERAERERVERAERERAERAERAERERAEREWVEKAERAEREERAQRERREQQELRERQQKQQRQKQREEAEDVELPFQTPAPRSPVKAQASSPVRMPAKSTQSSPRKVIKAPQAETDFEMADAPTVPASMLPSVPAPSTASSVPRATQAGRTIRRPLKPTKEAPAKTRQAPTIIRVNTSSSQQHQHQHQQAAQFHPSNSVLAANLHETLAGPPQAQHQSSVRSKASTASLHTKPSLQSLKSSVSSTGRPKALELAAKRKEQEEREAQRKRDAKADIERKRAAAQEQEEQRRQEAKKQREREREQAAAEAAAAKKAAAAQQRQAALERSKQTRAPPAASRTQLPGGPSAEQPPRSVSRLATATGSMVHRSQEELHRPVNAVLSNTGKALSKRALPGVDAYDGHGHGHSNRPGTAGGLGQAKRMRMSEEFDEDELEMGGNIPRASNIKGPPIRPSNGFKKDLNKSVFGNGYATTPASANVSRDLFKSTVTTQHNHQARAGNPMDMAQVSKAAITFANHGNNAAASVAAAAAAAAATASATAPAPAPANTHKTPLRPVGAALTSKSTAKSTGKAGAKSSPRMPNGDGIELPEIQTDDEDSEDEGHGNVAPWADSPDLRRALMRQETVDPFQVFGPPGPLNMEEVFHKSKDRWHKFRARTSSANWSGADRLTDEDIRKDLAARDKIRREGGWSYDLSRDLV